MKANVKFGLVPLALALLGVAVLVAVLLSAVYIPDTTSARFAAQRNSCIDNLRKIQAAKVEWAKELHKPPTDIPTFDDLCGTNGTNEFLRYRPRCPAGGVYMIGSVGWNPACSLAAKGHVLPNNTAAWSHPDIQSDDELRRRLVLGMSTNEVLASFGAPLSTSMLDDGKLQWRYGLSGFPEGDLNITHATGVILVFTNGHTASFAIEIDR